MRLAGRTFCAVYSCQQFFNLLRLRGGLRLFGGELRCQVVDLCFQRGQALFPLGEVIFAQADDPPLPRKAGKLPDRKTEADRGDDARADRQRSARALFLLFRLCRLLSSGFLGLLLGRFWRFCSPHRGLHPARLRRRRRTRARWRRAGIQAALGAEQLAVRYFLAALDTGRHIPSPSFFCLFI